MDRLLTYLRNSRTELAKVVWPSRQQAVRLSINIVIFVIFIALFIGAVDFLLTQLVQKVILKG